MHRSHVVVFVTVSISSSAALAEPTYTQTKTELALRLDDENLVMRGEIGDGIRIGGAATSLLGFGIGQAVEGRWDDTGWIFALGESASVATLAGGAVGILTQCPFSGAQYTTGACTFAEGTAIAGLIATTAFHIAGIVDAVVGPSIHNRHVEEARHRLGLMPYVAAMPRGNVVGLTLSF